MLIIKSSKSNDINKMLKKYKMKEKKTKQRDKINDARFFTKKSVENREKKIKAKFNNQIKLDSEI